MPRNDVTQLMVRHMREVTAQILTQGSDGLAISLALALVLGVRYPVGVGDGLVRPLKQQLMPVIGAVDVERGMHSGVELMLVVLTLEPGATGVALLVDAVSVLVTGLLVGVTRHDAGGIEEHIGEQACLFNIAVFTHFGFSYG